VCIYLFAHTYDTQPPYSPEFGSNGTHLIFPPSDIVNFKHFNGFGPPLHHHLLTSSGRMEGGNKDTLNKVEDDVDHGDHHFLHFQVHVFKSYIGKAFQNSYRKESLCQFVLPVSSIRFCNNNNNIENDDKNAEVEYDDVDELHLVSVNCSIGGENAEASLIVKAWLEWV
jgi:hypothetical protein